MDDLLHSVKVYVVKENDQWELIGSGHISTKYIERLQGVCLLIHSEADGSLILETIIHPDVPYKKQQRDVIVWTEANNNTMAIHFSDPNGCQDIWEDICQVQGKDPNIQSTEEPTEPTDNVCGFQDLSQIQNLCEVPTSEVSTLEAIANILNDEESTNHKERLAQLLENTDYIKKLLELFHTFEEQKNMEGLHILHIIIKGIFFLNNSHLLNSMISDECIMDVVGCLEYDPSLDQPYPHREFLTEKAKFKEIMPITHNNLRQKIHQTYRMQYICDILLPTPFRFQEDYLSVLSNLIFSNKIEIVTMLQEDEMFLLQVFAQLKDNTVGEERRHELLFFVREFCEFAKTLMAQNKDTLLKTVIKLGIMSILKVSVHMQDYKIKIAALEIFTYLVEYNPQIVRVYAMEEAQDSENDDDLLINILIKQIICDPDPASSQVLSLTEVFQALLDPENMYVTTNGCETSEFINFFYTHCMNNLAAPILSITGQNDSNDNRASICPDDYKNAQLLGVVLELLSFCVNNHKTYIRNYILSNNLLSRVLVLMSSKHTFLVLCALRFMRQMIGLNDEIYNLYIMRNNLFEPVVNAFVHNGRRYNMLNSAIIELFEFIKEENIKSLIAHIVENFSVAFESVDYVQTFKGLKIKYEEQKEREIQVRSNLHNIIYQKICFRHMKAVEVKVNDGTCSRGNTETVPPMGQDFPSCNEMFMKIKETSENEEEWPEQKPSEASEGSSYHSDASDSRMSRVCCSSRVSLVDYSDDDDDSDDDHHGNDEEIEGEKSGGGGGGGEEEEEEEAPPTKRPNLGS
ncbi:SMEK-like 3 [Sigmodon hispidus]